MFREISVATSQKSDLVDISSQIINLVQESGVAEGLCSLFVPHTTAAVTINENADPSVKSDLKKGLLKMLPAGIQYEHLEGNSEAHILSSIIGSSLTMIIKDGKLKLGTWQGIYFWEFDGPRMRKLYIKILV